MGTLPWKSSSYCSPGQRPALASTPRKTTLGCFCQSFCPGHSSWHWHPPAQAVPEHELTLPLSCWRASYWGCKKRRENRKELGERGQWREGNRKLGVAWASSSAMAVPVACRAQGRGRGEEPSPALPHQEPPPLPCHTRNPPPVLPHMVRMKPEEEAPSSPPPGSAPWPES